MKQRLALRVLGQVMGWDDERTRREYAWLEIMSRLKYDTYRGFVAGVRFIESLADWLQQFQCTSGLLRCSTWWNSPTLQQFARASSPRPP